MITLECSICGNPIKLKPTDVIAACIKRNITITAQEYVDKYSSLKVGCGACSGGKPVEGKPGIYEFSCIHVIVASDKYNRVHS